jgi:hypothetical protein
MGIIRILMYARTEGKFPCFHIRYWPENTYRLNLARYGGSRL